ncbi:class I SAM-dependent methyltransferase [Microvirga rosea]|uniref:class I SAM-dependent methyltransferase n=1 Tax=Microvirga rosea TaxID=2715425 RepID=UPI001D09E470|nr:class I SAM-dependent methyltransferase [Microvirga rosea]MCB8823278.1 class I SAM-dependent methyltransferase [Microvirga rosea]
MSVTDVTFTGSIPALYERYLGPLLFEPYAGILVRRMENSGSRTILETAAGTGIVTRALAATLPGARIVATDLNQAMLDLAATRLQNERVSWRVADAQALPFEDAMADDVVCQFGVMFFPDKVAAYREAHRVLKPGGTFRFFVWGRLDANPLSQLVHETVAGLFPEDPPGFFARVPFGYHDGERIRAELGQAGFEDVTVETIEETSRAPSAREPAIGLCQGTPLRSEIESRSPGRLDGVTDETAKAIAHRFGETAFENRMSALLVTAERP